MKHEDKAHPLASVTLVVIPSLLMWWGILTLASAFVGCW